MNNNKFVNWAFSKMTIACVLSAIGLSLGSFIDFVIVGNAFGERGLSAVNISLPIYNILNLIAFTVGTGTSVLISRNMGTCNFEAVKKDFTNVILLSIIGGLIIALLGNLYIHDIVNVLGARAELHDTAVEYVRYVLIAAPFFVLGPVVNILLRTQGAHTLATVSVVIFVVLNILLDFLFIFGFNMGIQGAGIAIGVSQLLSLLISTVHFLKKDTKLKLTKVSLNMVKGSVKIISNGLGVSTALLYQAIIVMVNNSLLMQYGGISSVSIYSVLYNAGFFVLTFFQGITFAITPILGTYYGEKNIDAIKKTSHLTLKTLAVSTVFWAAIFIIFPRQIGMSFGLEYTIELKNTLMIYAISVFFVGFSTIATAYFQSMHHKYLSMTVSLLYGIVITLPLSIILIPKLGAIGVAINELIAGICTMVFILIVLIIRRKKEGVEGMYLTTQLQENLPTYEIMIHDDLSQLSKLASGIDEFCKEQNINQKTAYYINLFVEELTVKIFNNGFKKQEKNRYVLVKIVKKQGEINLHIRDTAVNYNPFNAEEGESSEDRIGIDIVKAKAQHFDYQRLLVFNNLYVIYKI